MTNNNYKLRLTDFVPIIGKVQYDKRNSETLFLSNNSEERDKIFRRDLLLSVYEIALALSCAAAFLGIEKVLK